MNKTVYKSGVSNKFFFHGILALPYILSRPPNKSAIAFLFSSVKSVFVLPQSRAFLFVGRTLFSSFYKRNPTFIFIPATFRIILGTFLMNKVAGKMIYGTFFMNKVSGKMILGTFLMNKKAGKMIYGTFLMNKKVG